MENLNSGTRTISVKHHADDDELRELYLRQVGNDYFVYSLGRNGESTRAAGTEDVFGQNLDITLHHEESN